MSPLEALPIELILHIADYLFFPELDYLALAFPPIFQSRRYREHKRFNSIVRCLRPFGAPTEPHHISDRHFPTTTQDIRRFALSDDLAYYTTCLDLVTPTVPYLTFRDAWAEELDKPRGLTWQTEDAGKELRCRAKLQSRVRESTVDCEDVGHGCRAFDRIDFLRLSAAYASFPRVACLMLSVEETAVPDDGQILQVPIDDDHCGEIVIPESLSRLQHVRFTSRNRRTRDRVLDLMEFFAGLPNLHTVEIGQVDLSLPGTYDHDQSSNRSQSLRCIVFRESEVAIDWVYSMAGLLSGPCHIFRTSRMSDRIANPSWGHLEIPYKDAPQAQWKLELGAYATLPDWALQLLHRCDDLGRYKAVG